MELSEAVEGRRTIRKFKDQPVEQKVVEELIDLALWAPSWGNTQPFELVAAVGEKAAAYRRANKEALLSGKQPNPDIVMPQKWPTALKDRYRIIGRSVLESLSITRDDQEGRLNYYGDMFGLFDGPALILITVDRELVLEYALLDVGLFLQTFCLAAHARGLGTAVLAASVNYPDLAREHFEIPAGKVIVMGVSIGYPDWDASVNKFKRHRASVAEMVRWVD